MSKLGDAGEASPLSSTSIGMFSDSFRSCDMCNLGASFAFSFHFLLCTMLVLDSPWLIYRMLIALHLYLLSVAL